MAHRRWLTNVACQLADSLDEWINKLGSSVLVPQGRHNTLPQTSWLKTTEMFSLTVLETRRLKLHSFWGFQGRFCSWPLQGSAGPRIPGLLHLSVTVPLALGCVIFLCLTLTRALVIGLRIYLDFPGCSHPKTFNMIKFTKTCFPD